jgi:hypothetical protein
MFLFVLLIDLFLFVVIVVGFVAGLGMVALSILFAVLAVRARRRDQSLALALVAGPLILIPGVVTLGQTWRLAAWFFPPLIAEHRRFEAELQEPATLDPATEDVHRFVRAEAMYHASNGSHFDTPKCLVRPQDCIPGYTGPPFLDARIASLGQHGGFAWSFHAGPPPVGLAGMPSLSRSSIDTFALLGVPTDASNTSAHSVCGDFRGVYTFNGSDLHGQAACPGGAERIWGHLDTPPVIVAFDPPMALPGAKIHLAAAVPMDWAADWRFGGVPVESIGRGENGVELVVPKGAVSGKISVVTRTGTATSAGDFVVLAYTGLRVAPANVRLVAGQEQHLAVTASVSNGNMAEPREGMSWASSATAVATVDGGGAITARTPGTATITARLEGLKAVATVTVVPRGR